MVAIVQLQKVLLLSSTLFGGSVTERPSMFLLYNRNAYAQKIFRFLKKLRINNIYKKRKRKKKGGALFFKGQFGIRLFY